MKLIRYGTYVALKQGQEKLDLNILGAAFEEYVYADKPNKVNPFLTDNFDIEQSNSDRTRQKIGATNNRIQPKSQKLTSKDVLRTK